MKSSIRVKLSRKIKEFRSKQNMTQEELADSTGIDYKYIQKIEGKKPPNLKIETLEKIARALKIKPHQLLEK